jgi:hypothetical protein
VETTGWYRSVAHNELIQVLVPNVTAPGEAMVPMMINHEAYADVRLRTVDHDEKVVGDPGCFWMLGAPPEGVSSPPRSQPQSSTVSYIAADTGANENNAGKPRTYVKLAT